MFIRLQNTLDPIGCCGLCGHWLFSRNLEVTLTAPIHRESRSLEPWVPCLAPSPHRASVGATQADCSSLISPVLRCHWHQRYIKYGGQKILERNFRYQASACDGNFAEVLLARNHREGRQIEKKMRKLYVSTIFPEFL